MLTSGNGLQALHIGETAKRMEDVEQVHAFLHGNSPDRPAAQVAALRLLDRLRQLKENGTIFDGVELSEHVQTILNNH